MYTRRSFARFALGSLALPAGLEAARIKSVVQGVHLGVQTYSFRDFPPEGVVDRLVKTMRELEIGECEITSTHVLPPELNPARSMPKLAPGQPFDEAARQKMAEARKVAEEAARKWHLTVSLDYFKNIGRQFKAGGIEVFGYNAGRFGSDEEIDKSFRHAKAIGAKLITWSGTISAAQKVAPFAEKHKMVVAAHGHSNVKDPDQFATPESFKKVMAMSKYFMVNLDLGHFVAANFDPVAFLQENHARTPILHVKDRKKNQGPNTPFGQGDTPIKEALQLVKRNKWPIRAYVEYEYKGAESSPAEVKKCLDHMKAALQA